MGFCSKQKRVVNVNISFGRAERRTFFAVFFIRFHFEMSTYINEMLDIAAALSRRILVVVHLRPNY